MKPWSGDIQQHIDNWKAKLGNLDWWPQYVYHFTDVHNAAKIIQSGCLYSRSECTRLGIMSVDNASPEIIQQTNREHLQYVRLYFRPRTPTQYRNEGIRPVGQRQLGAHCPVPVFFCFDALGILAQDDTEFSNGNMGSSWAEHSSTHEFFQSIPFQYVFHNGWLSDEEKGKVIFHRNAEVLVPERLPLFPTLKFIACRSAAERQTLLHLLPATVKNEWGQHIRIPGEGLFERRWTFVQEVVVVDDSVIFRFNPNTQTPGPFRVRFSYQENGSEQVRQWEALKPDIKGSKRIHVEGASIGVAELYLDDALAFADTLIFDDLPF
ncbi:MAG TPA: DarT ssDNA thymidine ADP-ribosyltransferase family protein [Herpetosiphonaceae bacterium]|nr:DarT ssDNA thymidine ADP-ribosyltransferase family protein [Herpetosiphonaceae bacterium]